MKKNNVKNNTIIKKKTIHTNREDKHYYQDILCAHTHDCLHTIIFQYDRNKEIRHEILFFNQNT